MSSKPSKNEDFSGSEVDQRSKETLARLLATPPIPHKPKPESLPGASPKKRGRPAKPRGDTSI
jgi:hypothetical protein